MITQISHTRQQTIATCNIQSCFFLFLFFFLKKGDDVINALMYHPQVYNKCGPCAEYHRHVSSFSLSIDSM